MDLYRAVCVTLTLTLTLTLAQSGEAADTKSMVYTRKENSRVELSQEVPLCLNGTCRGGRTTCVVQCSAHAQCTGVNYRVSDGQCMGVSRSVYDFHSRVQADGSWENFSPHTNEVRDGEWTLVFRAQRGGDHVGLRTLQTWRDDTVRSDDQLDSLDPACFTSLMGSCSTHYRSRWLSSWPSAQLDKVRLALYTGGVLKAEMVFNGSHSGRDDWYHSDRLLSSTWPDLLPDDTNNVLAINGQLNEERIFVATSTADETDCAQFGWLFVMNNMGAMQCDWDYMAASGANGMPNLPQFLYSDTNSKINFMDGSYARADVMAIFIKLL